MPIGTTAGFDMVFGVSARTFGANIEGVVRPAVFALGPPIAVPGGTLTFDDLRVEAWFGTTAGNTLELRIGFQNLALNRLIGGPVPFGPGWSDFFVPATPSTLALTPTSLDVVLTLNFAAATFDADNEGPLQAAGLTEAIIAGMLGPAMGAAGLPNPFSLTNGVGITTVPTAPAAAPGAVPGLSTLAIAVQRRPTGSAPGEEAVAFLLTFQDRPDTPAGLAPGNPATIGPSTFGVGQDLLLEINNRFLFELLASLALEGGMGVPPGVVAATAAGVTLTGPAPVTIGGTAGRLTAFTLGAPAVGTTTLPLALTFTFVLDSITYIVTIAGATLTFGLANGAIVIGSVIPPATVTSVVPWWVWVVRILTGVALGILTGGIIVGIVGGVVGALTVVAETAIVSAIAGPSATAGLAGAIGGAGGGLIPPALAALSGGGVLTPPLVFDDLRAVGRATLPDVVKVKVRSKAVGLLSGSLFDLDTGTIRRPKNGLAAPDLKGADVGWDVGWDDAFGLGVSPKARAVLLAGTFSTTSYEDVSTALDGASVPHVPLSAIPKASPLQVASAQLPSGLVVGIRTSAGRLAKALVWRDDQGMAVLRFVVWDASAAAVRIQPVEPAWSTIAIQDEPDTPSTLTSPAIHHWRESHRTVVSALTNQLAGPIEYRWAIDGVRLTGSDTGIAGGARLSWIANGSTLSITTDLGESLAGANLTCEAIGAGGVRAVDSAQLTVRGRGQSEASPFEGALAGVKDKIRDAARRWIEQAPVPVGPIPGPGPEVGDIDFDARIRVAIRATDVKVDTSKLVIR